MSTTGLGQVPLSGSLVSSGQHTGLAKQVAQGKVSHVVMRIGINDSHPKNGSYAEIYSGQLAGSSLQAKLDRVTKDITTAVDTVLAEKPVAFVLHSLSDTGLTPWALIEYPDAAGRARVSAAITQANGALVAMAQSRGIVLVDQETFAMSFLAKLNNGAIDVGGEQISVLLQGDEPHHLRLGDSVGHAGTIGNGMLANLMVIAPLNVHYGLNMSPFSDAELLAAAGINTP